MIPSDVENGGRGICGCRFLCSKSGKTTAVFDKKQAIK